MTHLQPCSCKLPQNDLFYQWPQCLPRTYLFPLDHPHTQPHIYQGKENYQSLVKEVLTDLIYIKYHRLVNLTFIQLNCFGIYWIPIFLPRYYRYNSEQAREGPIPMELTLWLRNRYISKQP